MALVPSLALAHPAPAAAIVVARPSASAQAVDRNMMSLP
jgi:hypothetical protein